jgi:hypothetical protein
LVGLWVQGSQLEQLQLVNGLEGGHNSPHLPDFGELGFFAIGTNAVADFRGVWVSTQKATAPGTNDFVDAHSSTPTSSASDISTSERAAWV